jgi:hypothetical protein
MATRPDPHPLTVPTNLVDIVVAAMNACKAWRMLPGNVPALDPAMQDLEEALMPMLLWHARELTGAPPPSPAVDLDKR